jgi:hypothetical protein
LQLAISEWLLHWEMLFSTTLLAYPLILYILSPVSKKPDNITVQGGKTTLKYMFGI